MWLEQSLLYFGDEAMQLLLYSMDKKWMG